MSPLFAVLLRLVAPGLWHTDPLPVDAADQVRGRGWAVIDLDLHGTSEKSVLLDRLAVAANFPAHFGANWDAAYDCLTELTPSSGALVVLVRGPGSLPTEVATPFLGIVTDAVNWWSARGITAYVLWEGLAGHPTVPVPRVR